MTNPQYTSADPHCDASRQRVFVANVKLLDVPDDPLAASLQIDVLSPPGTDFKEYYFVTLVLHIEAPQGAEFVAGANRPNYHREVLADPAAPYGVDSDAVYWIESDAASDTVRLRVDKTALRSGSDNGHTFYVGIEGIDPNVPLRFTAFAAASRKRQRSCPFLITDLQIGATIPGPFGPAS